MNGCARSQCAECDRMRLENAELRTALERLVLQWRQRAEEFANEALDVHTQSGQHFYRNGQRWSILQAADELAILASPNLVICEGISGQWRFHIAQRDQPSRSICGERVMPSSVPVWGCQPGNDRIAYRWCKVCAAAFGIGGAAQ